MDFQRFARWFRASSPYIRAHRDKRFVVLLDHECLNYEHLDRITRDLALIHVLGAKLILVVEPPTRSGEQQAHELSTTVSLLRSKFERGLPTSRYRNQHVELVCNDYVLAQSSTLNTDTVPPNSFDAFSLDQKSLEHDIESEALVVVTPSITATSQVISIDHLIAQLSVSLQADKLIVFHEFAQAQNDINSDLSTDAFARLLESGVFDAETAARLQSLLYSCQHGVKRGHIVSYKTEGALLAELFTADGSGIQISTDDYLTIRQVESMDLDTVFELMRNDIEQDRIVPRTREALSDPSTTVFLAEHDNTPVGCVALYTQIDHMQEIGTLIAAPKHRDRNIGTRLLQRAESEARRRGASHAFVFSKHTSEWFMNHDYVPSSLERLPKEQQLIYDLERKSTLLIKELA